MPTLTLPTTRRPLQILAAVVAVAAVMLVPTADASAACTNAAASPKTMSDGDVRAATLCLLNDERGSRGLPSLRHNGQLATAAERHANDMADRHYFAHDSLDGRSFVDRIKAAGYVTGREARWTVGENLAWGSGELGSPGKIVNAWMNSPGHRHNILSPTYREIGFGLAHAGPGKSLPDRTVYATEFGFRR